MQGVQKYAFFILKGDDKMPARMPWELHVANGNTARLTKDEIEERKEREVKAKTLSKVKVPNYIKEDRYKKEFKDIAKEMIELDIFSNLDVDALGRFILAKEQYLRVINQIENTDILNEFNEVNTEYERLTTLSNKYFTMCRQAASDCGLTITSRCKIVIPKKKEDDTDDDLCN